MPKAMSTSLPALGICLEEYQYPSPVQFFSLRTDLQPLKMAYMDIRQTKSPTGRRSSFSMGRRSAVLLPQCHRGSDWVGYRVVAPDQIGWGKSPKPDIHYSFQALAANTEPCWIISALGKSASSVTRPVA